MVEKLRRQSIGLCSASDHDEIAMARVKQDALEGAAFHFAAARGHALLAAGRVAELDVRASAEVVNVLEAGGRARAALFLQLLQGFLQGRTGCESDMGRMPSCLADTDPHMKELQMRREGTRRRERRLQDRAVRFAAADWYQDEFH